MFCLLLCLIYLPSQNAQVPFLAIQELQLDKHFILLQTHHQTIMLQTVWMATVV